MQHKRNLFKSLQSFDAETKKKIKKVLLDYSSTYVPENVTVKDVARKYASETASEEPFFVFDMGVIVNQWLQWKRLLPRIKPFYAVKCNNAQPILEMINALGGGFDCASKAEIESVMCLGVDPSRIIFANPCKQKSHCKFASDKGVKRVTFDNEEELHKIKELWPEAEVVLRIITDDSHSICQFSSKFGARIADCPGLISTAISLGLNIIGISFHVGSGCQSVDSYIQAVSNARMLFDEAKRQGVEMSLLDVGGGFPGTDEGVKLTFPEIAAVLGPIVDELFPPHVEVIAEPGRYFACATHALTCNLFSKRTMVSKTGDKEFLYYINDGVYGSFNCIFFDHVQPEVETLRSLKESETRYFSTVFGPTCDALDCIAKQTPLPELQIGEWLFFPNFGAYTVSAASAFNGFKTTEIQYVFIDNEANAADNAYVAKKLIANAENAGELEAPVLSNNREQLIQLC